MARTAAEIAADFDATQPPPYPVSPTTEHLRKFNLGYAEYFERVAELIDEVSTMPPADQPPAIVGYALASAAMQARRDAAESRRAGSGKGDASS